MLPEILFQFYRNIFSKLKIQDFTYGNDGHKRKFLDFKLSPCTENSKFSLG